MSIDLVRHLANLRLVDHHVHSVLAKPIDLTGFADLLTESNRPLAAGTSPFDTQVAFAVRTFCGPLLGLEPHADIRAYWAARAALSPVELASILLGASGVGRWLVDTGHRADALHDLSAFSTLVPDAAVEEIVRLESLAEEVATTTSAATLQRDVRERLADASRHAAGLKSVAAYRYGFHLAPERPSEAEVSIAAGRWLREIDAGCFPRITDPILLRMLMWEGIDTGLPLQLHTGFGDPDLNLRRSDPALLFDWLKLVEGAGADVMLLHCYPFQRSAGFLAHSFPHVYLDAGLTLNYLGAQATSVLREFLELAPFSKILYSSDAWGLPELHALGALRWRRSLTTILQEWVDQDEWSAGDAVRVATMIGRENAERVYGARNETR